MGVGALQEEQRASAGRVRGQALGVGEELEDALRTAARQGGDAPSPEVVLAVPSFGVLPGEHG